MSVDGAGVVRVGDLAAGQWGMFTSAQAQRRGLSAQHLARLAKSGALERVRHGVYRTTASPGGAHDSLRAAWLALAPDVAAHERVQADDVEVVSHRSAAMVHRLGDLDADYLEFTTAARKQTRDTQVRFHRRTLGRERWTLVEGLPVTTVVTTIDDLAGAHLDGGHLGGVVRDALTTAHVDLEEVAGALAPHAHLYGAGLGQGRQLVQQLLEQAGVPRSTQDVARLLTPAPSPRVLQDAITAAMANVRFPTVDTHVMQQVIATVAAVTSQLPPVNTRGLEEAMANVRFPAVDQHAIEQAVAAIAAATSQLPPVNTRGLEAAMTNVRLPAIDQHAIEQAVAAVAAAAPRIQVDPSRSTAAASPEQA